MKLVQRKLTDHKQKSVIIFCCRELIEGVQSQSFSNLPVDHHPWSIVLMLRTLGQGQGCHIIIGGGGGLICNCLDYYFNCNHGQILKIQKGVARTLAHLPAYIDTFYFSENSVKLIQNFKEKGVPVVPWAHPQICPGNDHIFILITFKSQFKSDPSFLYTNQLLK